MLTEKNCAYVFLIFFNCYCNKISGTLNSSFMLFDPTNTILLIFIEKKFKFEIVSKQLKTSQKIFKILWCIEMKT